jgi:AraC-like DNA-binding protein
MTIARYILLNMKKKITVIPIVSFWPKPSDPDFPVSLDTSTYENLGGRSNAPAPHIHHMVEIGYIHSGYSTFSIADKYLEFKAGSFCIITHSEPHRAFFPVTSMCSWLYVDPARLFVGFPGHEQLLDTTTFSGPAFVNIFDGDEYPALRTIVENLIKEFQKKERFYQDQFRGLLLSLFIGLYRLREAGDMHFSREPAAAVQGSSPMESIGLSLDKIHNHFSEPLDCSGLAKLACMSSTNFRRCFKQVVGSSPYEYLSACRISAAVNALQEGIMRVEEIGAACGFEDPSAFRRAFKKRMGVAPARWKGQKRDRWTKGQRP